jgi:hypothetical protein
MAESNPKTLRKMASSSLDDVENTAVSNARKKFQAAVDAEEPSHSFTFADRSYWPAFQKLLLSVGELDSSNAGEMQSATEKAVIACDQVVTKFLEKMKERVDSPAEEAFLEETYVTRCLQNCVFVGHLATDVDSIAGAIGAAELFGGIATRSEPELNGEIMYVLNEVAELEMPPLFDDTPGAGKPEVDASTGEEIWKKVCLVDHNEEKQMVERSVKRQGAI